MIRPMAVGRCRLLRRGLPALVKVAPLPGEGGAQEMTGKFVVRQEGLQVTHLLLLGWTVLLFFLFNLPWV